MDNPDPYNQLDTSNALVTRFRPKGIQGEFTRRKNWSQSILDSVRDVMHVLTADLKVVYCSPASSEFLGYKPSELVDHIFTEFLHVDDIDMFIREFKTAKASPGQIFKLAFRFLRKDGKYTCLETRGQFHKNSFFGNARHIPTEVTKTIDTFLDLKTENELLKNKLAALRNQHHQRDTSVISDGTSNPSITTGSSTIDDDDDEDDEDDYDNNNNNINNNSRYNDNNGDIFTQTAPNVYTKGVSSSYDISESVSLFTGLRYDLGERAMGISMGLETGELINPSLDGLLPTSVANEPFLNNNGNNNNNINNNNMERTYEINSNQPRQSKKKRIENHSDVLKVCTDCGTTSSPEWRKGPNGPKTLCNACGIRWAKKNKQEQLNRGI